MEERQMNIRHHMMTATHTPHERGMHPIKSSFSQFDAQHRPRGTIRHRMESMARSLTEQSGMSEQLKSENQTEWVRQRNACKTQAEEVVKVELIYD
nr:TnpV protein [Bifidobacterium catenulatum]